MIPVKSEFVTTPPARCCWLSLSLSFPFLQRDRNPTMDQSTNAQPASGPAQFFASGTAQPNVLFTAYKKEALSLTRGYKLLSRKLKQFANVDILKEEISADKLSHCDVLVIANPQEEVSALEFAELKSFVDKGGSVLLLLGDGHAGKYSYMNPMLAPFGVQLNEDCVVRTVLHKYLHPKEVCVTNGITNREINRAAGKSVIGSLPPISTGSASSGGFNASFGSSSANGGTALFGRKAAAAAASPPAASDPTAISAATAASSSLCFVYPHGLTMNVQRPGVPILSSGFMAYPLNRPICSYYESPTIVHPAQLIAAMAQQSGAASQLTQHQIAGLPPRRGKMVIFGSALPFEDTWFGKEENEKLCTVLFDLLLHRVKLNAIDADNPDITDYHYLPDTASLADRLRVAVEEPEDLPRDFTSLFETTSFKFDTDMIPEVVAMYEHLHLKHEPLSLIHPEFQAPLPPCLPATFDPIHRELPPPALDLFDLDAEFSSERLRLSQLTNKCSADEDIEFFITEASDIMGVTKKLRSPRNKDPRALLDFVFRQLLQYKKDNPQGLEGGGGQGSANRAPRPLVSPANAGNPTVPGMVDGSANNVTRVLRISGRTDGSSDLTPFERNAPWLLTLHVDFARGSVMGQLNLQQGGPTFAAQQSVVQGACPPSADGSGRNLEWVVTLQNLVGEHVRFLFRGTVAPMRTDGSTTQQQLTGTVEWSGQSARFFYVTDELS